MTLGDEVVEVRRRALEEILTKLDSLLALCRAEEAPGEAAKSPTRPRRGPM